MHGTARITVVSALAFVACSLSTAPTTTAISCLEPPADQVLDTGVLPMEIRPNPAPSGSVVELLTEEIGLPEAPVVGIGLNLQCWTESGWTNLYRLTRDYFGEPSAIAYGTDVTFAEPAIGLSLPDQSRILVPDLIPGIYRISDAALTPGRQFPGFAYLEVAAP
jgi:hypothetical protein